MSTTTGAFTPPVPFEYGYINKLGPLTVDTLVVVEPIPTQTRRRSQTDHPSTGRNVFLSAAFVSSGATAALIILICCCKQTTEYKDVCQDVRTMRHHVRGEGGGP